MNKRFSLKVWAALFILCAVMALVALKVDSNRKVVIRDVLASAYYCPYSSEMCGMSISMNISGRTHTAKASFLFGGKGVAMQGTGRISPNGLYIHYSGGGGKFVRLKDKNEFTEDVQKRYAALGIKDFAGFYGLALSRPDKAKFSVVDSLKGACGRTLMPAYSVAVDPKLVPLGTTGKLLFSNRKQASFRADDVGGSIKGNRIDVYAGEGEESLRAWYKGGGNRKVTLSFRRGNGAQPLAAVR